jgi:hypothetical protein
VSHRRFLLLALLVLAAGSAPAAADGPPATDGPATGPADAALPARLDRAIDRGVAFLVGTQNADGSWGSPAPNLFLDIYSPVPGALEAYAVASSALALSALLEVGEGRPGVAEAIRKATDHLLARHAVRRIRTDVLYNNWAHAYALAAFARLLAVERDPARAARLRSAAGEARDLLLRYRYVDGGWGYYDFSVGSRTPSHGHANSFTTSTALVALAAARDQGVAVPPKVADEACALVRSSRLPGGAFAYSWGALPGVPRGVNAVQGSLARTPACLAALLAWGDPVPAGRTARALDLLEEKGFYLQIARKYPAPHESWFQNSGYFCFYGYYYASLLLPRLDAGRREFHAARIPERLLPLQEPDGSWWDYQLFQYHKTYGTGYVLMTLGRCRSALTGGSGAGAPAGRVGARSGSGPTPGPRAAPGGG